MGIIFTDENQSWQFDFSRALWATDKLHEDYMNVKDSILHDVDFIVEDEQTMLLIECKNANFKGVSRPSAFEPVGANKISDVARKYYDSIHFVNGVGKGKNKSYVYVYIVEARNGNITERKAIRNRLKDRLPFRLQEKCEFMFRLVDKVEVLNFDEWNKHYPQYPAKRLKEKKWKV
mgnify:CR=1 FL=1